VIEDTLKMIYAIHHKSIDIEKLSTDDKKTYQILQKGQTVGIFQLESAGFQRYLKQLKPTSLEDIIAMVALYRPGPIKFIPTYIKRKQGREKIKYIHPKLKPILESTQGICIYQEQLMKIAQELAGFSLGEADILRKAVGKKIKSLLIAQKKKLIAGMKENGVEEKVAQKIWEWVIPFARYGFNRSHSACYSLIAYQTAYLKAHHPLEFMACLLTSERNDLDRISILIEECKKMEIEVLPPDINESFRNFSVVPESKQKPKMLGEIRFGLSAVKNVGNNIVENIVKERKENGKFKSIEDFISRISCKDLNKKSMESLTKAGAFDNLEERNKLLSNMEMLLESSRENHKTKINGQKGLFEKTSFKPKIKLKDSDPAQKTEKLKWEKELLGLYISGHPLDRYQKAFKKSHLTSPGKLKISHIKEITSGELKGRVKRVRIGAIITNLKKIITKNGKPMFFLKTEDLTDKIEIIVFPKTTEKSHSTLKENNIVLISGKVDWKDNNPKIIAEEIEEVIEQ
jgi:DNA polymerase-3 subunit alpha